MGLEDEFGGTPKGGNLKLIFIVNGPNVGLSIYNVGTIQYSFSLTTTDFHVRFYTKNAITLKKC